jgi:hypothetical protein
MKSAAANKSPLTKRAHIYNDDGEEREKKQQCDARVTKIMLSDTW